MLKLKEIFDTPAPTVQKVFGREKLGHDKYHFFTTDKEGQRVRYMVMFVKKEFIKDAILVSIAFAQEQGKDVLTSTLNNAHAFKVFSMVWKLIENYFNAKKLENIQAFLFAYAKDADDSRKALYDRFAQMIDNKTEWKRVKSTTYSGAYVFIQEDFLKNNEEELKKVGYTR
jgi:hypothetical protein